MALPPARRLYAHVQPQHLDMRPQMRQNLEALRQQTLASTLVPIPRLTSTRDAGHACAN